MSDKEDFIVRLYPAAEKIARETGMSKELILAQAAQETGWGQHVLPGTHNIFNIKASPGWKGPTKTFNVWEIEHGAKVWKDQDFRVYGSVEEALRDRIKFLESNPRYRKAGLFDEATKGDFAKEAAALQKAGYATDPNYAVQLEAVYKSPTMQRAIRRAIEHGSDTSLAPGAKGAAVRALQSELNELGYLDGRGRPLRVDGDFGERTLFAVRAFQRDHHLADGGKVGPDTQAVIAEALKTRTQGNLPLTDPRHADHALFEQALAGVRKIDADMGRTSDQQSINLAASLVAPAKAAGLARIDTVGISEDGSRTFAVENRAGLKVYADVSTARGVNEPVEKSSAAALSAGAAHKELATERAALAPLSAEPSAPIVM